jgi:hypothetical protein
MPGPGNGECGVEQMAKRHQRNMSMLGGELKKKSLHKNSGQALDSRQQLNKHSPQLAGDAAQTTTRLGCFEQHALYRQGISTVCSPASSIRFFLFMLLVETFSSLWTPSQ